MSETAGDDLRSHLLAIREQYGKLTPQCVVDEARDPAHPLHSRFEWDDSVAGEMYRRQQASGLIRSARVTYQEADESGPEKSVRAFVSIANDTEHAYEPVEEVAQDPFKRQLALNMMQREWKALYNRYREFEGFLDMVRQDVFAEDLAEVA